MEIKGLQSGIGISSAFPATGGAATRPASSAEAPGKFLGELVGKVNDLQKQADHEIQKLATGESKGLHEVMLAVEKSGIAFQFLNQVRNKAVESYQEIMRMQV